MSAKNRIEVEDLNSVVGGINNIDQAASLEKSGTVKVSGYRDWTVIGSPGCDELPITIVDYDNLP